MGKLSPVKTSSMINISWENHEDGHIKLDEVKNKILERVRQKNKEEKGRLSLSSSVTSYRSQKRPNSDSLSEDPSCHKPGKEQGTGMSGLPFFNLH